MKRSIFLVFLLTLTMISGPSGARAEQTFADHGALQGVDIGKGLFDINLSTVPKLELYLSVIKKTHQDLVRQGKKPEFIIAFRGASVRLINSETWSFPEEEQQSLAKSAALIKELQEMGAVVEACSIATELFKVENSTLLPGITVVGNTFVSLIGYQAQGYALIPIQ